MTTEMKRTTNALQPALMAAAARPCTLGHGYDAAAMGSWSKQAINEFTPVTARRLRKRTT